MIETKVTGLSAVGKGLFSMCYRFKGFQSKRIFKAIALSVLIVE
jgi:hypothetical protein